MDYNSDDPFVCFASIAGFGDSNTHVNGKLANKIFHL
jgi:hypothetical protein